jgi:hypothetical protein
MTTRNPHIPHMARPLARVEALVTVTEQLRQGMESLAGDRGDSLDRAVTFNDLLKLGLITQVQANQSK